MPATETTFRTLAGVPVHYDRLDPPYNYGSKGRPQTFRCTKKLKSTLESCLGDLFDVWGRGRPSIILTAGTIGDGGGEHGRGLAFDLDGFFWTDRKFMMLYYPTDRPFYIGINAHLFLYFSQVLAYHYPNHRDHFHVDFNFSKTFRPESNAQTFFVQACLRYLFHADIGRTGIERDGVDGIAGPDTRQALEKVLKQIGIGSSLRTAISWKRFLLKCRNRAFKKAGEPEG
jgi:hypothetical protein